MSKILFFFKYVYRNLFIAYYVLKTYFELYYPVIKSLIFKLFLSVFLILLNTFVFKSLLDLNNNLHFMVMILGSRLVHYVVMFIYDESELFKLAFFDKKWLLLYKKLKTKIRKSISLDNILSSFLVCLSCIVLKKFILGLNIFDFERPLNLCLLTFMLMIFSMISKYLILNFIKGVKDYLRK